MLENLLYATVTVFAVIGLVAVIYFIMLRFIRPKKDETYYEVVVFDAKEENASLRVSFLLSLLISTGNIRSCRILAVDNGMRAAQKKSLCEAFRKEKSVVVCTADQAMEILFGGRTDIFKKKS